jgi:hypothetical protein
VRTTNVDVHRQPVAGRTRSGSCRDSQIDPFLFILYIVSFLDRVNVGFAALEMNRDSLFEVPSNLILARVGARLWIARIIIT